MDGISSLHTYIIGHFFILSQKNVLLFYNLMIYKYFYYFTDNAHCKPDHEANIKYFN